jgi:hypothetical protein
MKANRTIIDGIVSVSSLSKALQGRGSAARLRAMESDLGDFSNTNSRRVQSRTASLESSMALSGCFGATGASRARKFQRSSPGFCGGNQRKFWPALREPALLFWTRLEMTDKVSGVMKDKRPSPWKSDGSLEFGCTVPF